MSKSKSSLQSIGSHKEKKYDTIPFRLEFIKELLNGKKLEPMFDVDNDATENFVSSRNGIEEMNSNDEKLSNDTRHVLNKKLFAPYRQT